MAKYCQNEVLEVRRCGRFLRVCEEESLKKIVCVCVIKILACSETTSNISYLAKPYIYFTNGEIYYFEHDFGFYASKS